VIRQVNKTVRIIMLTVFDDNKNVLDAIFAGASGYLLKGHCFEKLYAAITDSLAGGAPLSAGIAKMLLDHVVHTNPTGGASDFGLTARELEILQNLVTGSSYKMIATSLFISFETVKTHIHNIYEKLQVHSQSEAVAKALRNKIV
jgi:DNA-binding NarL/FixJ family response regulator